MATGIEWTDETWNPLTGCTKVSPGCDNCYAKTMHERFNGPDSFDTVTLHPERLDQPLRWRKPRKVFVNSMSDLFHQDVPDEFIAKVWQIMASTPQHTYQILTKRHARMRAWVNRCALSPGGWITHDGTEPAGAYDGTGHIVGYPELPEHLRGPLRGSRGGKPRYQPTPPAYGWPLPNVWLGVSVENQQWANTRIGALVETPAAVHFLSCEPLLGEVVVPRSLLRPGAIDWVIVGGESGSGARPMHIDWARSLRDQCTERGTAFLFKQWGSHDEHGQRMSKHAAGRELDGRTWDEYPAVAS